MDFPKVKNQVVKTDDSNLWAKEEELSCSPKGISSIVPVKSEPVDSRLEDLDGCGGVIKKNFDESESDNELENPLFVTVKEEPDDETSLDHGTFKLSDSAEGPLTGINRLPRDGCCASMVLDTERQSCFHHCNYIRSEDVNPEERLIDNEIQTLCKQTLSTTECEIPLDIASTSEIKKRIYESDDRDSKTEQSGEMEITEIENEKSAYKKSGRTLGKLSIAGCKETQISSSLNMSSKETLQYPSAKKTYKCSQCEKIFNYESHLARHMHTHTGESPFKCSHCEKTLRSKYALNIHLRQHTGEKPFKCDQCGKSFIVNSKLSIHMRQHTGEKPFQCDQCEKSFARKLTLIVHMRQHTGEKPFCCNHCGKAFNQSSHLNFHMQQHTGEKPFQCNCCGKAFGKRSHLTTHMRLHTGEKPFKCNQCGKAFAQSSPLIAHMRLHEGEKHFKCNVCNKAFARKGAMTQHMVSHTST